MKNVKRFVALLIAAVLCVGYPVGITEAADWCPGSHSLELRPQKTQTFTSSTHKVYRDFYVGNEQAYSICAITVTITYQVVGCKNCVYEQWTQLYSTEAHSLEGDPDHNESISRK